MNRKSINILVKISIITTCFIIIINLISGDFNNYIKSNNKLISEENKYVFKSADSNNLWNIALAITTNIWIWYKKRQNTPINSYKDIKLIWSLIWDSKFILNELIKINMLAIKDYLNFVKIDIKSLLNTSKNRKDALENIIWWLELRYKNAIHNISILNNYRISLIKEMTNITNNIEILKTKMNFDVKKYNSQESIKNINKYVELKENYNSKKVKVVYINHFLKQYTFLNNYTKILLDTLINNKEAIINKWHIVIPDSWDDLIKKFDLIYSETKWKNELKKEEN